MWDQNINIIQYASHSDYLETVENTNHEQVHNTPFIRAWR
jgi:hypothetical protein